MKRYSIVQKDMSKCFICGQTGTHIHEVYFGRNRQNSIKYGCCVGLCPRHHNASDIGVHFNKKLDDYLKQTFEIEFLKTHTIKEFQSIFRANYL